MAYNTKSIIKDVNNKPIPQYFNRQVDNYEVVNGKNGMLKVIMIDSQGREIQSQALVDQIADKLDDLIEVVEQIGI